MEDYSFGYVMGTLKGDGSLHRSIDYHYFDERSRQVPKAKSVRRVPRYRHAVVLSVKDKDFADAFAEHLEKVIGKKPCRWVTKRGEYKVISVSKEWYEKLFPFRQNIAWILDADKETKRGFLRAMFDSDGCVIKRIYGHRVFLTQKRVEVLETCQKLLAEFSIKSHLYRRDEVKGVPCSRLSVGDKTSIDNYRKEIGFYIQRKGGRLELA